MLLSRVFSDFHYKIWPQERIKKEKLKNERLNVSNPTQQTQTIIKNTKKNKNHTIYEDTKEQEKTHSSIGDQVSTPGGDSGSGSNAENKENNNNDDNNENENDNDNDSVNSNEENEQKYEKNERKKHSKFDMLVKIWNLLKYSPYAAYDFIRFMFFEKSVSQSVINGNEIKGFYCQETRMAHDCKMAMSYELPLNQCKKLAHKFGGLGGICIYVCVCVCVVFFLQAFFVCVCLCVFCFVTKYSADCNKTLGHKKKK